MVKYESITQRVSRVKLVDVAENNIDIAILNLTDSECKEAVVSGVVSVEVEAIPEALYTDVAARYFFEDSEWAYLGFKYLYDDFSDTEATLVILVAKWAFDQFLNMYEDQDDIVLCKRDH